MRTLVLDLRLVHSARVADLDGPNAVRRATFSIVFTHHKEAPR